jgi:hypothetical protein
MVKLDPIVEAQQLRATSGALRRRLMELNGRCIDNFSLTLVLMKKLGENREALAKRYPWLVARV